MNKRLNNKTSTSKERKRSANVDVAELINTGHALQSQSRIDEAIKCFEQVLRAEPGHAYAIHLISLALIKQNKYTAALSFLRKWATHPKSDNVATQYYIAYSYHISKRYKLALAHLERALAFEPGNASTRILIAQVFIDAGKPEQALEALQRSPAIASAIPEDMVTYATMLSRLAQYQEAKRVFTELLHNGFRPIERLDDLIRLPPDTWSPEICEQVFEHLHNPNLSARQKSLLHFSAGRIADHQAHYEDAFRHFGESKKLSTNPFDFDTYSKTVGVLLNGSVTPLRKSTVPSTQGPDVTPVFVLGLPRSGKTLLEELLALRPEFAACGEIRPREFIDADLFIDFRGRIPDNYQNRLMSLKSTQCTMYAGDYIRGICEQFSLSESTRYILNTLPFNFLNILPLRRIFPSSKFIFVTREMNDLFVFNYMQKFKNQFGFTRNFETFTRYCDLTAELISHWREQLGPDFLTVSYSDIVTSPEDTLKQVRRFLGVEVPGDTVSTAELRTIGLTDKHIGYWKNYQGMFPHTEMNSTKNTEPAE